MTRNVRQDKIDRVVQAREAGLTPSEIVKATGYSRSTVYRVLSGKATGYLHDPFGNDKVLKEAESFPEEDRRKNKGPVTQISTTSARGRARSIREPSLEREVIRKEQDEGLAGVVATLSQKDQAIIKGRCDGLSDKAIKYSCKTSYPHIKALFRYVQGLLRGTALDKAALKESDRESKEELKGKPRKRIPMPVQKVKGMKRCRGKAMDVIKKLLDSGKPLTSAEVEMIAYFEHKIHRNRFE